MARKDAAFAFSLFGHNREHVVCNQTRYVWTTLNPFNLDVYYNILSLSGDVRPFHPSVASSVPSSIHPGSHPGRRRWWKRRRRTNGGSSSLSKCLCDPMLQFIKNSCSLAICQKLQTNFKKLKIVEKKMRKREEIFLKQHKKFQIKKEKKK